MQTEPKNYLLVIKRKNNDFLPIEWHLLKRYNGEIVVVKYGGNAMINPELKEQVMEDIVLLHLIGVKVVLVHGGGPEISELMAKLGKKPEFVDGLRVTDKETVDIVQKIIKHPPHMSSISHHFYSIWIV